MAFLSGGLQPSLYFRIHLERDISRAVRHLHGTSCLPCCVYMQILGQGLTGLTKLHHKDAEVCVPWPDQILYKTPT